MNTKSKAERFWDRTAKSYDREERNATKTQLKIIEKTKSYLKPSDIVLDFGCATGAISKAIAEHVNRIHAIDISSKMIEIAKTKNSAKLQNIEYKHASISDKSITEESFDTILAFYILHLLDDPNEAANRLNQLLKPGGLLISVIPCLGGKPFLTSIFSFLSKLGVIPKINPFTFPDLEMLFEKANFEVIENERLNKNSQQYLIVARKK